MAKNKTTQTESSVSDFINVVEDETKRDDSFQLIELFKTETGFEPVMWGPSIIGFGSYHYKYESGHEGDMPLVGFSPRKDAISLYLLSGTAENNELLKKLGKHKSGKACLYVKKLTDINLDILREMVQDMLKYLKDKYPS